VNKSLKEFWDEICLPENHDIRDDLFRLDYIYLEKDTDGASRFEEIQEELEYVKENDENFIKTHHGWGFNYVVTNADWLFVKGGEVYGILFEDEMVIRDTEFDAGLIGVQLHNYPFWENEDDTWESLILKKERAFLNYRNILNKYLKICEKHGLVPCLGNSDGSSMSQEEFDALVYKDFKGE
jgi:hypothetical protein